MRASRKLTIMSRTATNPQAWLNRLQIAKTRAEMFGEGEILTAEPMAKLLGTTWEGGLRTWCSLAGFEESGAFVRGGPGVAWEFNIRATVDWLIGHFQGQVEAQVAKSRRTEKILSLPDGSMPDGFTLQEVDKSLSIYRTMADEKRKAREWVLRQDVEDIFRRTLTAARDHILGVIGVADPNGVFPPEIREKVERATVAQAAAFAERCEEISRSHEGSVPR